MQKNTQVSKMMRTIERKRRGETFYECMYYFKDAMIDAMIGSVYCGIKIKIG